MSYVLKIFIGLWVFFSVVNYYIYVERPNQILVQEASERMKKIAVPQRQNEAMYVEVLSKLSTCIKVTDKENNDFYSCPDGSKVSMINWTRSSDRKGVVTRFYDKNGTLQLIYGHPDDVH